MEAAAASPSKLDTARSDPDGGIIFVEVPQEAIGRLFGVGGKTLKALQEVSNCSIRVEGKEDRNGEVKQTRSVKIVSRASSQGDREDGAKTCAQAAEILCAEDDMQVETAFSKALEQQEARTLRRHLDKEAELTARKEMHEAEMCSYVHKSCGDSFDEESIRNALDKENWDPDEAINRLYNERSEKEWKSSSFNVDRLLKASRVANEARRLKEIDSSSLREYPSHEAETTDAPKLSKNVMRIHDAIAKAVAKGAALKEKEMHTVAPPSVQQQHNHGDAARLKPKQGGARCRK